jgi:hypothetical protein
VMQILQLSLLVHAKSPTSIKLDWHNWNTLWDAAIKRARHTKCTTPTDHNAQPTFAFTVARRQQRCHCHQTKAAVFAKNWACIMC